MIGHTSAREATGWFLGSGYELERNTPFNGREKVSGLRLTHAYGFCLLYVAVWEDVYLGKQSDYVFYHG